MGGNEKAKEPCEGFDSFSLGAYRLQSAFQRAFKILVPHFSASQSQENTHSSGAISENNITALHTRINKASGQGSSKAGPMNYFYLSLSILLTNWGHFPWKIFHGK